ASGGVVYYVLRKGVTGARKDLAEGMAARLRKVRALTGKAVIAGFGVSGPAQARRLARSADGVVVGSALVAAAAGLPVKKAILELTRFTRRMTAGLEGTC
ncbi:MAG: tryptophan synthase subunit alpha, partial [Elusimicrobiota bacterium]